MQPLKTKDYALVFAANNDFISGFLVTLASALASSNLDRFNIYLLHDQNEVIDGMSNKAHSLCQRFNFPQERFNTIPVDLKTFDTCDTYGGNYLSYARLHGIRTLKESKILYLDSDMLVLGDLAELIQSIPDKVTCAAAIDGLFTHNNDGYLLDGKPGPSEARYFNAGLLILDTQKCSEIKLFDQFIELTKRVKNAQYGEQSFLNIIFKNNWFEIPEKWNRMTYPGKSASITSTSGTTKIFHYITTFKPWCHSTPDCANILWHSVAKSINVKVDTEVYNELVTKVKTLKRRKKWGIMQFKHVYYKLRGKTGKKSKQLIITKELIENTPRMDNWLICHGFNEIPKSLRLTKNIRCAHGI